MYMMRPIAVYLLIVTLLACPLFCLGDAARACAAPEKPTCCRAPGCESSPAEETPATPREQDADCLCHGAIVAAAKVDGPHVAGGYLPPAVAAPATTVCDARDAKCSLRRDSSELPCESGRYLCALFCTRLL